MIVHRYLFREMLVSFLGVTLILLLLLLSATFVRILAEAMAGHLPVKAVFTLLALKSVANMVLILPISLYLGIMLALGRLHKDSEMVVMSACGIGHSFLYKSVSVLAGIVGVMVACLVLFFAPWVEEKSHQIIEQAQARVELELVVPGRFNQLGGFGQVIYAEERTDGGILKGIFAQQRSLEGKMMIITAREARQVIAEENGARYLVLYDGYRYEGQAGDIDYRIVKFSEHGLLLQEQEVVGSIRRRNAIPTSELWSSSVSTDIAELHWRFAVPISVFLLALLAVPLSKSEPRKGRYGKLFAGIVILIIYNNLLSVARSALGAGSIDPVFGLWWVHLLMAATVYLLHWKQQRIRAAGGTA